MPETKWQKSSYSADADGNACVELALASGVVLLRESDDPHVVLTTTPASLGAFVQAAKSGAFDQLTRR
jgi:hypothetical protein